MDMGKKGSFRRQEGKRTQEGERERRE